MLPARQYYFLLSLPVQRSESWSPVGRRRGAPGQTILLSSVFTCPTQRVLILRLDARRGLPVRCPKSYNLPSDAARAPPVPGFSSPYSPRRLSVWQRSLGLMSRRRRGLPVGSYACRPHATLIHSMPWVSISRRMLWEPPCRASQTLFICLADRTHPSVGGGGGGIIGGFMGPLGQISPSVLWLAGADGQ